MLTRTRHGLLPQHQISLNHGLHGHRLLKMGMFMMFMVTIPVQIAPSITFTDRFPGQSSSGIIYSPVFINRFSFNKRLPCKWNTNDVYSDGAVQNEKSKYEVSQKI
jgi:hypothetical protein